MLQAHIIKWNQVADALRESAAKLKEAQRIGKIGYWEHDLIADRITWSEETGRIFGLASFDGGMSQAQLEDMTHPDDRQLQRQALREALQGSWLLDVEFRIIPSDSDMRFVHVRDEIVYDESGRPIRMFGTVQDITERKQAEQTLRRLNRELQAISNCNQALLRATDEQTLLDEICRIVCNEASYRMAWAGFAENDAAKTVRPAAAAGSEDGYLAIANFSWGETERGRGPVGTAIRSGETICVQDFATDPGVALWRKDALQRGYRSKIALPLKDENAHTFGVLCIYSAEPNFFTPDEVRLLEELAGDLAFGIITLRTRAAHKQAEEELRRQATWLHELSRQVLQAQEVERRAIARELHDEIGQVLTAVSTNLQTIQLSSDAATLAERLNESVGLVDEALRQIRDLSLDLRPSMLDDFGLVPALEWFVDRQAQRSGFSAELAVEPAELRMPPNLETTVFRVAQIALTNVARHAQATHVCVALRQDAAELELLIRDDGIGFDVAAALERASRGATFGLLSMQERVRLVGGTLEIESTPGMGTEIRVRLPVERKDVV